MGMEKRALLAFVLSLLFFLAYDYLYLSPKMKEQRARRQAGLAMQDSANADSVSTHVQADRQKHIPVEPEQSIYDAPDMSETPFPTARPDSAGIITVVTPLYCITFSKAGGEIRSVQLFEFETSGQPVELMIQDSTSAGMGALSLLGENRALSLSNGLFDAYLSGIGNPLPDGHKIILDNIDSETEVVFRSTDETGREISRYYRLTSDSYLITAGVQFTASAYPFVRQVSWGFGPGMASTEMNKTDDYRNFQATIRLGEETHKQRPSDFARKTVETYSGMVLWGALQTKYFTMALIPEKPSGGEVEVTGEKETHTISAKINLPAAQKRGTVDQSVMFYLGPLDYGILKSLGVGLERNINMGFKLFRPVSWLILWALIGLYKVIPNYGVVIILLSVITKVLFYRLTHKSFKSMRDLQALQPKLQALKEKYKDDRQKISQETMRVYKEHGVNPLGGCLPLLLQMPVFIALFSVLKFTIELREASFFGWITNLAQQDVLTKLPFSLPLIGSEVSVLPLLMGAAMLFQTKIGGSMTPGSTSTQPKVFNYMLPIVFTFIFYKMPSGLVLYWFVNNVLTIAQQYYINKEVSSDKEAEAKGADDKGNKPSATTKDSKSKQKIVKKEREKTTKGR